MPNAMPVMKCRYPSRYSSRMSSKIRSFNATQRQSHSSLPQGSFWGRWPVKQQHFSIRTKIPSAFPLSE